MNLPSFQTPFELKTNLAQIKAAILEPILQPNCSVFETRSRLNDYTKLIDEGLQSLWAQCHFPSHASLMAVGGYGRHDLYPHSDIDVMILLPTDTEIETDCQLKSSIETFVTLCWDAGLEIGSSVRTLSQCLTEAKSDVTIATALLEARWMAGSQSLVTELQTTFPKTTKLIRQFYSAKKLEQQQRYAKYESSPYALEPNCKESPGAWRDLHTIIWISKAAGWGHNWQAMYENGFATRIEYKQLIHDAEFLMQTRARLHLLAKRREDRLLFDFQVPLAQCFGLASQSDLFMQHYYQTAKSVTILNELLLLIMAEKLFPTPRKALCINERFNDAMGLLDVADPNVYHRYPDAILETFLLFESRPTIHGLSAQTLRALYNARHLMYEEKFRALPANKQQFLAIFQAPEGITHALRLMNQTGVLGQYIPQFERVIGKMQHDLFHIYTVDQHTLMVVRNLRRFFIAEHAHEFPFCSYLASNWNEPWLLYLAALFHDLGKGRGGDHSVLGSLDAKDFCKNHDMSEPDSALIIFLVREHLTMSRIAQKEDISDAEVVAKFAKIVKNEKHLTALYLLTVADIFGTAPKVWNSWKGQLLQDLYHDTIKLFDSKPSSSISIIEKKKFDALTLLALQALPMGIHLKFWEQLDVSYFMRHDANEIAWHTKILSRYLDSPTPIIKARLKNDWSSIELLIYTPDSPLLFAKICAYFTSQNASVYLAKIHTTRNHYALNTFQILSPKWVEDNQHREYASILENGLFHALISHETPLTAPKVGRLSRRARHFPTTPRVEIKSNERNSKWVMDISTNDHVGLLYTMAFVMAVCHVNVVLAKINTLGERVEDTFVIDGEILKNEQSRIEFETQIMKKISQ